jgi:carotenoid cleavage dioxygenase-like enzyme
MQRLQAAFAGTRSDEIGPTRPHSTNSGSRRCPGHRDHTSGNVLLKEDVESGAVEEHRFEHGAASEAVFAPVSLSAGEDEGYVMA